ncbi:MAG TPA: methyltransferase domain-containing protein [Xanthomonadaceae bacterium]|nr:methyltransferase domain-containing protein [Xanthomonadaceae bacterium]
MYQERLYDATGSSPAQAEAQVQALSPLGLAAPAQAPGPRLVLHRRPLPDYLVRHYWWAYLWRPAVWFFDHQPIINAIVFGHYRAITDHTLRLVDGASAGDALLIASAYGNLVPRLAASLGDNPLTVIDVAPIQLERAQCKLDKAGLAGRVRLAEMNAESLSYAEDRFDTALMFLLLHELPVDARRRALVEALRVVRPGGRLVLSEYGERTGTHPLHRIGLLRWILGTAEPFLPSLWHQDLDALVAECAREAGKRVVAEEKVSIFSGFYRSWRYRIERL